jgi:hypothetical protein
MEEAMKRGIQKVPPIEPPRSFCSLGGFFILVIHKAKLCLKKRGWLTARNLVRITLTSLH